MPFQRSLLFLCLSISSLHAQIPSPAFLAEALHAPAKEPTFEEHSEAVGALLAAEDNLAGGNTAIAERAAFDALKLEPSSSLKACILITEAAWQASLLPPQNPAELQRAQGLLDASLVRHPDSPYLLLLRARMKLHDGAITEAEALAKSALDKLAQEGYDSAATLQRSAFAALVHARRGEWQPAAKLVIEADDWPPGYEFARAAAAILEHAIKDGIPAPDLLRWTRSAYSGAHQFLSYRDRGPEIEANEDRQLALLAQTASWDALHSFLREIILPACPAPAGNARLLALLEPVAQAGTAAFLLEKEAAKNNTSENLSALVAMDDLLGELQPRFAKNPRFLEIRFEWAHATAAALLAADPGTTIVPKERIAASIDACQDLLPSLGKDWRHHAQVLRLLNQSGRAPQANSYARKLYDNAEKLGVTTTDDWTALGNTIEFSNGKGTLYENLAFSCYERAVKIDTKTNHLNFAAIIGKLRLGPINTSKPEELLDIVNQLTAQFPAEATAREAEVFFVRKRLCQLIVDSGRHLDAVIAYVKIAQLTPKDRFIYHYNAALNLVAYLEAAAKNADWTTASLPDVKTAFNRPAINQIFTDLLEKNAGNDFHINQLKEQQGLLDSAFVRGIVTSDLSRLGSSQADSLASYIRDLRSTSSIAEKSYYLECEAFIHSKRLERLCYVDTYSQSQLDEARARRDRIAELGASYASNAREYYDIILTRNRNQIARENARRQNAEAEARQQPAYASSYQTRPAPEPRFRWCMRCYATGYRTVWEDQQDPYTGRYRRVQTNRTCDRCYGKGTHP